MKKRSNKSALSFSDAFKYPFNNFKRMFNILWVLFPIFGWFALFGYGVRIVKSFIVGAFSGLPEMLFGSDMKLGFFMFLKSLPFMLAYIIISSVLSAIPVLGGLVLMFLEILVVPILGINFMKKETIESFFEFGIVKGVFDNLGEYLVAMLKSIGLAIVFMILTFVLVGIPGLVFTSNIFIADFYRRYVK